VDFAAAAHLRFAPSAIVFRAAALIRRFVLTGGAAGEHRRWRCSLLAAAAPRDGRIDGADSQ